MKDFKLLDENGRTLIFFGISGNAKQRRIVLRRLARQHKKVVPATTTLHRRLVLSN